MVRAVGVDTAWLGDMIVVVSGMEAGCELQESVLAVELELGLKIAWALGGS